MDPPATIVTLKRIRSVAPRVWAPIVPVVNVTSFPKVFPFVGPYNTLSVEQAEFVHRSISTEYTGTNVTVTLTWLTRTSRVLASASRTPAWRALMSDRVHAEAVVGFVAQSSLHTVYVAEFAQFCEVAPAVVVPPLLTRIFPETAELVVLRHDDSILTLVIVSGEGAADQSARL